MSAAAIFGRERERQELDARLRARRSFVLHAPSGMGKTALLRSLLPGLSGALYCPEALSRESVFTSLWRQLEAQAGRRHRPLSALGTRGRVRDALAGGEHLIILDHLRAPSTVFGAGMRDLARATGAAVIAVARSAHMEELGSLYSLYPDRAERYALPPLTPAEAEGLVDWHMAAAPLPAKNLSQFRAQALEAAAGNPGLLLGILGLARQDRYWRGGQILFTPLWIDLRLRSTLPQNAAAHA
ncbi:MAG: hypothetical protein ACRD2E_08465 [Terriglobales bacterium]